MHATSNIEKQLEKRQKMFLVITLVGLSFDLDLVHIKFFPTLLFPMWIDLPDRLLRLVAPYVI